MKVKAAEYTTSYGKNAVVVFYTYRAVIIGRRGL